MSMQEQIVTRLIAKAQSEEIVWTDHTASHLDGDERFTAMVDVTTFELTREGASFDWRVAVEGMSAVSAVLRSEQVNQLAEVIQEQVSKRNKEQEEAVLQSILDILEYPFGKALLGNAA